MLTEDQKDRIKTFYSKQYEDRIAEIPGMEEFLNLRPTLPKEIPESMLYPESRLRYSHTAAMVNFLKGWIGDIPGLAELKVQELRMLAAVLIERADQTRTLHDILRQYDPEGILLRTPDMIRKLKAYFEESRAFPIYPVTDFSRLAAANVFPLMETEFLDTPVDLPAAMHESRISMIRHPQRWRCQIG